MLFFLAGMVGREIKMFPERICLNSQCLEKGCETGLESQAGAEDLGRTISPNKSMQHLACKYMK